MVPSVYACDTADLAEDNAILAFAELAEFDDVKDIEEVEQ